MKFCWRITKYDPQYRDENDVFSKQEWTSYSDIGREYNNIKFTYNEYSKIEHLYIQAITLFMQCCNIESLQVVDLEKPKHLENDIHDHHEITNFFYSVNENDWLTIQQLEMMTQLLLRERLWCKLINKNIIYIHFGYDFYLYIGTNKSCEKIINKINNSGLYIEKCESPYKDTNG